MEVAGDLRLVAGKGWRRAGRDVARVQLRRRFRADRAAPASRCGDGEPQAVRRQAVSDGGDREGQAGRSFRVNCRMGRSEEHTSELQSLMRISYAVFCLKKKIK